MIEGTQPTWTFKDRVVPVLRLLLDRVVDDLATNMEQPQETLVVRSATILGDVPSVTMDSGGGIEIVLNDDLPSIQQLGALLAALDDYFLPRLGVRG